MGKKMIQDTVYNIIASIIPVMILQLIIYPIIAQKLNAEQYGFLLTISSLLTVSAASCGNVINNIRLLQDNNYKSKGYSGDFNILVLIFSAINTSILFIGTLYYEKIFDVINIILILILGFLTLIKEYYIVEFRLNLDYKKILINNILLTVGYIFGMLFFLFLGYWQIIYIVGLWISCIHILKNTKLHKETLVITPLFSLTFKNSFILLVAGILNSLTSYIDRLLLYPLMGGNYVAIYYAASIFGKIISLGMSPVSSVMLSYFSKMEKFEKNNFRTLLVIVCGVGIVGYLSCILISKPLLLLLYPQFYDKSIKYIPFTTAIAMINMIYSFLNPIVLKFCKMSWQMIINGSAIILYCFFSSFFILYFGLIGFCWCTLLIGSIKVVALIVVYYISIRGEV